MVNQATKVIVFILSWIADAFQMLADSFQLIISWLNGSATLQVRALIVVLLLFAYLLFPYDIIPDNTPYIGFVDDFIILLIIAKLTASVRIKIRRIAELFARPNPAIRESRKQQVFEDFEEELENECVICFESNARDIVFHKCGHNITCEECSQLVNICPFCRAVIENRNMALKS